VRSVHQGRADCLRSDRTQPDENCPPSTAAGSIFAERVDSYTNDGVRSQAVRFRVAGLYEIKNSWTVYAPSFLIATPGKKKTLNAIMHHISIRIAYINHGVYCIDFGLGENRARQIAFLYCGFNRQRKLPPIVPAVA
jgi:hypothetical protein